VKMSPIKQGHGEPSCHSAWPPEIAFSPSFASLIPVPARKPIWVGEPGKQYWIADDPGRMCPSALLVPHESRAGHSLHSRCLGGSYPPIMALMISAPSVGWSRFTPTDPTHSKLRTGPQPQLVASAAATVLRVLGRAPLPSEIICGSGSQCCCHPTATSAAPANRRRPAEMPRVADRHERDQGSAARGRPCGSPADAALAVVAMRCV